MKKANRYIFLFLLAVGLTILAGCGKEEAKAPEQMQPAVSIPAETEEYRDTDFQEQDLTFDYEPGSMGIYVKVDPNIEAGPEVLDSITMTLSDKHKELTRQRVSNYQFDFIKSGHQIGGFVLVDIPRDMLKKVSESYADFEAVVDHLAKQVMPDAYPSKAHISGGGHVDYGFDIPMFLTFMIEDDSKDKYIHHIYIGENYIYDFWHDTAWLADSGETIMSTLSAEDIKPELNQSDGWTIHDFSDLPGETRR